MHCCTGLETMFLPSCTAAWDKKQCFFLYAPLRGARNNVSSFMHRCVGLETMFLPSCNAAWSQKQCFLYLTKMNQSIPKSFWMRLTLLYIGCVAADPEEV